MNNIWLEQIVSNPELMSMGHGQRAGDKNLGMGWMYYALARMYRPATVVCIGSWRGFVPMMFARGMQDNAQSGTVHFVDPGMVDDHWQSPESVSEWFDHHDVNNITHHKKTTQQFVETNIYRNLHNIDILFVDGYHSAEQAQYDHEAFVSKLSTNSICTTCTACPVGFYRSGGCSGTEDNICSACPVCSDGFYPHLCGGNSPGVCTRCTNFE